jgi:hypothetical protein
LQAAFAGRLFRSYFAVLADAEVFGGLPGVPRLKAATVPTATPTAAMAPSLISNERLRPCFAGAMADPAGLEAPLPAVFTPSAAAVPSGSGEGACLAAGFCSV